MSEKTILKLYANGDVEPLNVSLVESEIMDDYSFNENTITIPKLIKYDPTKSMPVWVQDTGNPISIFPQGIVYKGNLIGIGAEHEILFSDDFNRPDSIVLGAPWEITSGGFGIKDNQAFNRVVNNNEISRAVVDVVTQNNVALELGIFLSDGQTDGLMFRYRDNSNHFQLTCISATLELAVRVNGTKIVLQSIPNVFSRNVPHRIVAELRDDEIKIFVNDVLRVTTSDTRFINSAKCGFIAYSTNPNAHGRYDNFEVRRLT